MCLGFLTKVRVQDMDRLETTHLYYWENNGKPYLPELALCHYYRESMLSEPNSKIRLFTATVQHHLLVNGEKIELKI
jgi:hypothetical protein